MFALLIISVLNVHKYYAYFEEIRCMFYMTPDLSEIEQNLLLNFLQFFMFCSNILSLFLPFQKANNFKF